MNFFLKTAFVIMLAAGCIAVKGFDRFGDSSGYGVPRIYSSDRSETLGKMSMIVQKNEITVLLDSYFNNEKVKDKSGNLHSVHYKWNQGDDGGYSIWGDTFRRQGARIKTTYDPPSEKNLQGTSIYIITDPDIPKENPDAKYMTKAYADVIAQWVAKGGVLVLTANDSGNADIRHFNLLARKFGFLFNEDSYNHVPGRAFDSGAVNIASVNDIFKQTKRVYIKELATISPVKPVKKVLVKNGHIIAVTAHYGQGIVFAVGDPWFYNEYVNGRKLPETFQNVEAMQELTEWLIHESNKFN